MGRSGRRLRGRLLRLVFNRTLAVFLGLLSAAPALWLLIGDYSWETPITDGLGLVVGATGAALLLAGLGGRRGDWVDPNRPH
jgi:hypothetical protein